MPIRFRCAYCNQLLGIARRKAGTVVRCPTCAGQVVVPAAEAPEPESQPGEQEQLVFERSDFEDLLNPDQPQAVPGEPKSKVLTSAEEVVALTTPGPQPGNPWAAQAEPAYAAAQAPAPVAEPAEAVQANGIFVSRARATLLMVLAVVALALAFGGGVVLGYYLRSPPETSSPASQK
jgi:phage FluMu protein Com